ncbi:hypothetical protein [Selenomonas ruminantium]|uniref:hypothetical protein n=1 Tax=Selenomonas ruminantium TaxID=971 RepID=UPI0026F2FF12|nr:hypothetical protein [Selenomonas ruminantium]
MEHKKYIGILGTPKIEIRATSDSDLKEKDIIFENVELSWNKHNHNTRLFHLIKTTRRIATMM